MAADGRLAASAAPKPVGGAGAAAAPVPALNIGAVAEPSSMPESYHEEFMREMRQAREAMKAQRDERNKEGARLKEAAEAKKKKKEALNESFVKRHMSRKRKEEAKLAGGSTVLFSPDGEAVVAGNLEC